jgi:release factor glutamine methyltransferase
MLIKEAIAKATIDLEHVTDRAKLESEILLCSVLECDRIYLHIYADKEIDTKEYFDLIHRRSQHEPIEYITNSVSFYSEEFFIDYGALIPRPETEILIDKVLPLISKDTKIVEIGVGSGIISVMLAKLAGCCIDAIDISENALKIARKNIEKFDLVDKISLHKSDLLDEYDKKIDVIVSNPPYIEDGIELDKALSYEPQNALFGGNIGDEILKQIIDQAYIRGVKVVACEMGYDQKDKIENYLRRKDYHYTSLEFYKDLSNLDRGFVLTIK